MTHLPNTASLFLSRYWPIMGQYRERKKEAVLVTRPHKPSTNRIDQLPLSIKAAAGNPGWRFLSRKGLSDKIMAHLQLLLQSATYA